MCFKTSCISCKHEQEQDILWFFWTSPTTFCAWLTSPSLSDSLFTSALHIKVVACHIHMHYYMYRKACFITWLFQFRTLKSNHILEYTIHYKEKCIKQARMYFCCDLTAKPTKPQVLYSECCLKQCSWLTILYTSGINLTLSIFTFPHGLGCVKAVTFLCLGFLSVGVLTCD